MSYSQKYEIVFFKDKQTATTTAVNFTNILQAAFLYRSVMHTLTESTKKLQITLSYKKAACKMLVKLTPARRSQKCNQAS